MEQDNQIQQFGAISTASIKSFCESTRKDGIFLQKVIASMKQNFFGFVETHFALTPVQSAQMRKKLDQESAEVLAATCVMALRKGREIHVKFELADPAKIKNLKVTWRTCPPDVPTPPETCCGLCVNWEC